MNRTFSSTVQLHLLFLPEYVLGNWHLTFFLYRSTAVHSRSLLSSGHTISPAYWVTPNLLGYLIGAFWAMKLPQNAKMPIYIIFAALFGSISLFACAFAHFNEVWYLVWRIISGIGGGLLMILSPSIVAQCSELQHRFKINLIGFSRNRNWCIGSHSVYAVF